MLNIFSPKVILAVFALVLFCVFVGPYIGLVKDSRKYVTMEKVMFETNRTNVFFINCKVDTNAIIFMNTSSVHPHIENQWYCWAERYFTRVCPKTYTRSDDKEIVLRWGVEGVDGQTATTNLETVLELNEDRVVVPRTLDFFWDSDAVRGSPLYLKEVQYFHCGDILDDGENGLPTSAWVVNAIKEIKEKEKLQELVDIAAQLPYEIILSADIN